MISFGFVMRHANSGSRQTRGRRATRSASTVAPEAPTRSAATVGGNAKSRSNIRRPRRVRPLRLFARLRANDDGMRFSQLRDAEDARAALLIRRPAGGADFIQRLLGAVLLLIRCRVQGRQEWRQEPLMLQAPC